MNPPRVVGLDLSLTGTGVARYDGTTTCVKSPTLQGDARLVAIARAVEDAIRCVDPNTGAVPPLTHGNPTADLTVVEDLPRNARGAGATGMAQGAARVALVRLRAPYALVPPAALKKYATGNGNADKADMRMALYQRTGIDLRDNNEVDAWWLRHMGLDHLDHPDVKLPAAQRAMLDKITWPKAATP
ncbi:Holliday junction endonuclease [Embleya sp. NPDC059237]|uniref:Holliday junction endonuclease n=1 Tax=Embleya sp. NPDC059237 TaxID=3346784 RepID=UPI0036879A29